MSDGNFDGASFDGSIGGFDVDAVVVGHPPEGPVNRELLSLPQTADERELVAVLVAALPRIFRRRRR